LVIEFFCVGEVEVKDVERFEGFEAVAEFSESSWIKVNMRSWVEIKLSEFWVFEKLGVLEGFQDKGVMLVSGGGF